MCWCWATLWIWKCDGWWRPCRHFSRQISVLRRILPFNGDHSPLWYLLHFHEWSKPCCFNLIVVYYQMLFNSCSNAGLTRRSEKVLFILSHKSAWFKLPHTVILRTAAVWKVHWLFLTCRFRHHTLFAKMVLIFKMPSTCSLSLSDCLRRKKLRNVIWSPLPLAEDSWDRL